MPYYNIQRCISIIYHSTLHNFTQYCTKLYNAKLYYTHYTTIHHNIVQCQYSTFLANTKLCCTVIYITYTYYFTALKILLNYTIAYAAHSNTPQYRVQYIIEYYTILAKLCYTIIYSIIPHSTLYFLCSTAPNYIILHYMQHTTHTPRYSILQYTILYCRG